MKRNNWKLDSFLSRLKIEYFSLELTLTRLDYVSLIQGELQARKEKAVKDADFISKTEDLRIKTFINNMQIKTPIEKQARNYDLKFGTQ